MKDNLIRRGFTLSLSRSIMILPLKSTTGTDHGYIRLRSSILKSSILMLFLMSIALQVLLKARTSMHVRMYAICLAE